MPRVHGSGKVPARPAPVWRTMRRLNRRLVRVFRSRAEAVVLVLTTKGRTTGRAHDTPLQYELVAGVEYVASARGPEADWFQNILADPRVEIQIGNDRSRRVAEPITEPARIADFLALRRKRHPFMLKAMFLFHGLRPNPSRAQLEKLAKGLALVALRSEDRTMDSQPDH